MPCRTVRVVSAWSGFYASPITYVNAQRIPAKTKGMATHGDARFQRSDILFTSGTGTRLYEGAPRNTAQIGATNATGHNLDRVLIGLSIRPS
jgi:hypothetical protein